MKLIVDLTNVHRDEQSELIEYLEENSWSVEQLTQDELSGLTSIINYVISNRLNGKASDLSYLDLLNVKNKLQK